MRQTKALLAISFSTLIGLVISTLVAGCQPTQPGGGKPSMGPVTGSSEAPPEKVPEVVPETKHEAEAPPVNLPPEKPKEEVDQAPLPPGEPGKEGPQPPKEAAGKTDDEAAKPENEVALAPTADKPTSDPTTNVNPTGKVPTAKTYVPQGKPTQDGKYDRLEEGNVLLQAGDWNQWGGSPLRNNVPVIKGEPPTQWAPGKFDRKTGAWDKSKSKNIRWVATAGSQTYGNTVVASGHVFVGSNNGNGYLKRYPSEVDLGCLLAFDEKTGEFRWQSSSEKLPTGRVHDWPLMGVCCSPLVEGDKCWYVTSRGEVRCVDVQGFYDDEDDGPVKGESGRLFDLMKAEDPSADKVAPAVKDLDAEKIPEALLPLFKKHGEELPADVKVTVATPGKKWTFKAQTNGAERSFYIVLAGPRLSAFKVIGPADKQEADTIWVYDMMKELKTSQHNMCSCSVTSWGDILFVNTSNGVDESHLVVPAPQAPSFIAMDKNTGELLWQNNGPQDNILHGQWGSPAVGVLGGVPQVIFGGGDGWLYSFKADKGKDGKPELLWKFDANPKAAVLELGGRGTRNDIISTPVIYDGKVYFATGQDPEHGEGTGILWCLDPTLRGDVSEQLAVNREDPRKPIPVKRIQAVVESEGDLAILNPKSAVIWKYEGLDKDKDDELSFEETFHRSISTVAIKDDLLFIPDFSGLFHCIDAQTGKPYWAYDMLAAAWGSAMIAGDKVYVGDEDGDIAVFDLSKESGEPIAEINMATSVYSSPIIANGVLYIANKERVFAISDKAGGAVTLPGVAQK